MNPRPGDWLLLYQRGSLDAGLDFLFFFFFGLDFLVALLPYLQHGDSNPFLESLSFVA